MGDKITAYFRGNSVKELAKFNWLKPKSNGGP
jgi:hypothetical protein